MIGQGNKALAERLEYVCKTYTKKAAITYLRNDGTKDDFTFGEIYSHILAAKEQFSRVYLQPGDRAAIISPHTPFVIIAGYALAYSNITIVPIDAMLPTEEINRLLEFSDVRAVFTIPEKYKELKKKPDQKYSCV